MSTQEPNAEADKRARRDKLVGRMTVVAFGVLLLAYLIPLAWSQINLAIAAHDRAKAPAAAVPKAP